MLDTNFLTIRLLDKIYVPEGIVDTDNLVNDATLAAFIGNVSRRGYGFTEDAYNVLKNLDMKTLTELYNVFLNINSAPNYEPMYPNFPQQVAEASDIELIINAYAHYLGDVVGVRITPIYEKEQREEFPANEGKITVLDVASYEDLEKLTVKILTQGDVFTSQNIMDIEKLSSIVKFSKLGEINIPIKENAVDIAVKFPELNIEFSTVVDALRLATKMSEGDISLASNTRFKLSKKNRRRILSILENIFKDEENVDNELKLGEFLTHPEKWKKLAYALHPSDYAARYPHAVKALKDFTHKGRTFNSLVENSDFDTKLELLSTRPGVFARRLNELVKEAYLNGKVNEVDKVLSSFEKVVKNVPVKTLVQLWNFFNSPYAKVMEKRLVQLKNGKAILLDNTLTSEKVLIDKIVKIIEFGLTDRIDKKIFISDKDMASGVAVPLNTRNFTDSMKVLGRGSRIKVDGDVIRLFVYWKDIKGENNEWDWLNFGRVDIDLSAYAVNENFDKFNTISYYHLRDTFAYHSGDITSAPHGAAEFIDVDIDKALEAGYRYILVPFYNFTGQSFDKVPELSAGFMMRNEVNSGEIFEPKTVENRFNISSKSTNFNPMMFDLENRELIWLDTTIRVNTHGLYNVRDNEDTLVSLMNSVLLSNFMKVDKLVELVGNVVDNEADADIVVDSTKVVDILGLIS